MAETVIDLAEVTKRYGAAAALDGVNLNVPRGQFVALVGGSGSGKTTLLKSINRLSRPDSGAIRVLGEDVTRIDPHILRRRIGYAFQEVGLFPHMTIGENLAIGPRLAGWDVARIGARTDELLDLVALPRAFADRAPSELSGGQRQRIGVARALAAEPKVMLLDEPFGALDPLIRESLGDDYRALHERLGLTTVMVTHDMAEAVLLADRVVVLKSGRIVADGTPEELVRETADPEARALLEAPRRQAERLSARLGGRAAQ